MREAVQRADQGSIDAALGAGLIKQRVARPGQGRRGGYRTIIAYVPNRRAVFLYGFAKSERDNISDDDLEDLLTAAAQFLGLSEAEINRVAATGGLVEIRHDEEVPK